jgi:hypothetical protein
LADFNAGWAAFGFHRWNKPIGGEVKDRPNQPADAEPEIPSPVTAISSAQKGRSDERCGLKQDPG